MPKTIQHSFPDLFERMDMFEDHRKRKDYTVAELVTGCLALFLFKEASRNAINNDRKEEQFQKNYQRVFKIRLPHMDAAEDFLRQLKDNELEHFKAAMLSHLLAEARLTATKTIISARR